MPSIALIKAAFELFKLHRADTASADKDALKTVYSVCRSWRSTLSSTKKNEKRKYRASVSCKYPLCKARAHFGSLGSLSGVHLVTEHSRVKYILDQVNARIKIMTSGTCKFAL